jgi:thiamine-phosphate pyrophosphorylase
MKNRALLKGIYVLTDAQLTPKSTVLKQMERILKSGVSVLQYRDKHATYDEALLTCKALQTLCDAHDALFIIDDRLDIAREINADGLHIGEDDVSYEEARVVLGNDAIIGVSCYGNIERALTYQALGADYVAFGSFFPSPTKPHSKVVPLDVLHTARKRLYVPICAIGGINRENIATISAYDIAMYSVISAVYENDAIEANIAMLQESI